MSKEILKITIIKGKENPPNDFGLGIGDCFKYHAITQFKDKKGFSDMRGHGDTPLKALTKLIKLLDDTLWTKKSSKT